uniref:Uncharacterized protein n=1 Tax=Globodera rostochiensis TaxID=31243 RepID=A0A914IF53_GLORO
MKAYGGVVKPPGFYKIVLRDRWRSVQSALCADVFEYVMRDIIQKDNAVVYIKRFFNYEAESNLEEFKTIYIHMFPLDKNKKLIHSSSEPKFFLQNVMKKTNWKNCNEEFYLAFYHFAERDFKISKLLSRWVSLSQNAKLSDEEAFLLKAYLRDVTEKLVKFFTNGLEMKTRELNILFNYGNSLLKCQNEENSKMLVNLANVGTASKELPKTDKTHFKKVQKATGGTGVFHSVLLPHLRNID